MPKIRSVIVIEFISYIFYAAKKNQFFKLSINIIYSLIFKSYRNKLPKEICNLDNLILKSNFKSKFEKLESIYNESIHVSINVSLAGKKHKLYCDNLWSISSIDPEEELSLHRFGWLLIHEAPKSSSIPDNFGIYCIVDWILKNQSSDEIGWDSYSISERVSNWVIYLNSNKFPIDESQNSNIRISIQIQLEKLLSNLELRGGSTNNHIINNGRALYLCGVYFNIKEFIIPGKRILIDCLELMFSSSGFLREGSSHYQILLARSYIEVLWFGNKYNDTHFESLLKNKVKNIWIASCFFLEEEEMPIFGDISPDYPIGFHDGVALIGEKIWDEESDALLPNKDGWHSFFIQQSNLKRNRKKKIGLKNYPDSGYCRFRNNMFTIYIYTNPIGYVASWSHGHSDIGHYILYIEEKSLLIGTGRVDYTNMKKSNYGRSIKSHNSIEIDSREPMIVHGLNAYPELMHRDYYYCKPNIIASEKNHECIIKIEHNGYKRLFKDINVIRIIKIQASKVVLEDMIDSKKIHNIKTFFHFSPDINIRKTSDSGYLIKSSKNNIDFSCSSSSKYLDKLHIKGQYFGTYSPNYGVEAYNSTIVYNHIKSKKIKNSYIFNLNG